MSDDAKALERRLPRVAGRSWSIPFDLSWPELAVLMGCAAVLAIRMMTRPDPPTIATVVVAFVALTFAFVCPLNRAGERAIHLVPRYTRFVGSVIAGDVDVHWREVEGRHYTHRPVPHDAALSPHLGKRLYLSSFEFNGRHLGLLVQGGSRLRPWRAAYLVVVQVAGRDQLLLESADHQETLLARWTAVVNATTKKDLGLSGFQELMVSRPLRQGEGAGWDFEDALVPELADGYRQVQLAHDRCHRDRKIYLVLRSGGTFSAWVKGRHYGSNRAGAEEHFRGVHAKLSAVLSQATLNLVQALDVHQLSAVLRLMVDPHAAPAVGYREGPRAVHPVGGTVAPISHWKAHRSTLEVNGSVAATYRVVGWPDTITGVPGLLSSALAHHQGILRVSVVMQPEDAQTARYLNKAHATNSASKADRKAAKGQVTTQQDVADEAPGYQRDAEMAKGHTPLIYAVYATLVCDDDEALQRAGDDLATQCDSVGVDIANCHANQGEAFAFTMPFARGC